MFVGDFMNLNLYGQQMKRIANSNRNQTIQLISIVVNTISTSDFVETFVEFFTTSLSFSKSILGIVFITKKKEKENI